MSSIGNTFIPIFKNFFSLTLIEMNYIFLSPNRIWAGFTLACILICDVTIVSFKHTVVLKLDSCAQFSAQFHTFLLNINIPDCPVKSISAQTSSDFMKKSLTRFTGKLSKFACSLLSPVLHCWITLNCLCKIKYRFKTHTSDILWISQRK